MNDLAYVKIPINVKDAFSGLKPENLSALIS